MRNPYQNVRRYNTAGVRSIFATWASRASPYGAALQLQVLIRQRWAHPSPIPLNKWHFFLSLFCFHHNDQWLWAEDWGLILLFAVQMGIGIAETFRDIFKPKVKIEANWDFLRLLDTKFPGSWRVWKRKDRVVKIFPQVISMEVRQLSCFTDGIQLWGGWGLKYKWASIFII